MLLVPEEAFEASAHDLTPLHVAFTVEEFSPFENRRDEEIRRSPFYVLLILIRKENYHESDH